MKYRMHVYSRLCKSIREKKIDEDFWTEVKKNGSLQKLYEYPGYGFEIDELPEKWLEGPPYGCRAWDYQKDEEEGEKRRSEESLKMIKSEKEYKSILSEYPQQDEK